MNELDAQLATRFSKLMDISGIKYMYEYVAGIQLDRPIAS